MSFLGGPECSTAANPLAQFQKQSAADTSLQRDRLTNARNPQLNGFRSQQGLPDDAAFQDFAQQGPQFGEQMPNNSSFHMEQMRREAESLERSYGGGGGGGQWAGEFAQQGGFAPEEMGKMRSGGGGFNPQEFAQFRQGQMSPAQRAGSPAFAQQQQGPAYRAPMYGGGMGMGMQRPMFGGGMGMQQPQMPEQMQGKGKGRVQELSDTDWEKQFEELSSDQGQDLDALDREAEAAIEKELDGVDRSETNFGDFESIWNGIQQETNATRDMLAEEEAYKHFGDEADAWQNFDSAQGFDGLRTHDQFSGELGHYLFEENNLFKDVPNAYEEGMKIVREGGNLSLAALAFEAAVQRDENFVEAWVALGQAQAQNEKESPAIRALEQALKLDPDNLEALMGLAVSYTNESFDSLAYRSLERWVSVRYPQLGVTPRGLDDPSEEHISFTGRAQLQERVTDLFLEAAQLNPEGTGVDVDVQVGLGVLFYGSEDYDKAVDCFTAALDSAQHGSMKKEGEEHLLWNRLGATLANSGRSEEAIEAYSRALEINSNFVRARYNLGVSCINLGVNEQAASHLLGALSMHRVIETEGRQKAAELLSDGNGNAVDDSVVEGLLAQNQSTNLYDTLRRTFMSMNRRDLSDRVGPDMDLDALRGEFDF